MTRMNIAAAVVWLAEQQFEQDGVAAMYTRGETELAITVVPARTTWEQDASTEGAIVRMDSPDFFIIAADLGALTAPADGDTITYDGSIYKIMSPDGAMPWQWATWSSKLHYRIHTKKVDTV